RDDLVGLEPVVLRGLPHAGGAVRVADDGGRGVLAVAVGGVEAAHERGEVARGVLGVGQGVGVGDGVVGRVVAEPHARGRVVAARGLVGAVGRGRAAVVVDVGSGVGAGAGHEHGGVVGGVGVADRDDGLAVSGGVVVQQVVVLAGDPVGTVQAVFEYAQV